MNMIVNKHKWKNIKLGDVCEWYQKDIPNNKQKAFGIKYYVTANHIDSDSIRFHRFNDLSDGQKGPTITKHFEKGDLLLSTRSVALRKAALAPVDGVTGEKLLVLRVKKKSDLLNELLPFILQSIDFWEFAQNSASGSVNKFTSWTKLREYEFLLPPKDQQAELSELLWTMNREVEKNLELLEKLYNFQKSFFKNGVEEGKGQKKSLSDILIPKKEKSQFPHTKNRYIGLEHIDSGAFRCNRFEDSKNAKAQGNIVEEGDLCYSKLRPYLDKAFIADFEAVSTTELLVYDTQLASKEYVLNHFHSPSFLNYISKKGFGTKMPRVNHKIIGEYKIKVLDDETTLLNELQQISKVETNLNLKISNSKALQKSLINQIF
tara:strand:+ start:104 stop:1231 length:1128 start_codon:yes stop_codon:yes gene_type:complete